MARRKWVPFRLGPIAVLSAVLAIGGLQAAAQQSAALSICSTENCATLTVTLSGTGGGTVTTDDGNIDCRYSNPTTSGTCGERIIWAIGAADPTVIATAVPLLGSVACYPPGILGCSAEGVPYQQAFTLSNGESAAAPFVFNNTTRTLNASVSGTGHGTVVSFSAQISCPTKCSSVLSYGWAGTLTAEPSSGSVFQKWTGACAGQGPTCQITVTTNAAIAAEFDLSVAASPSARAKPAATAAASTAGQSLGTVVASTSPGPTDSGSGTASGQVQSTTAAPTPPASAAGSDPTNHSGSDPIPWLPIFGMVVVIAIAINLLAFQVLRARRPPS